MGVSLSGNFSAGGWQRGRAGSHRYRLGAAGFRAAGSQHGVAREAVVGEWGIGFVFGIFGFLLNLSTGICFIGERRFRDFLQQYLPAQPGVIETPDGEVIGEHMGLMYYTLGQRQGLGIGGLADYPEEPWYVAAKDLERNVLVAVQGKHHPLLYTDSLATEAMDWVAGEPPAGAGRYRAKTRYRQADEPCTMTVRDDGGVEVHFDEPQRAVTPGQSLVLYDGEICLGGGVIRDTWNATEPAP